MKKQSVVMQIISQTWYNLAYPSHQNVNAGMQDLVRTLINLGLPFVESDFENIYKSFRGGYWFGVSSNGKTLGEHFYSVSCGSVPNISAAQSFEKWRGRKPFILQNHRLYQGARLTYNGLCCSVTGFDDQKGLIYLVGYKNAANQTGRKLFNFSNEQFLIARKEMKLL